MSFWIQNILLSTKRMLGETFDQKQNFACNINQTRNFQKFSKRPIVQHNFRKSSTNTPATNKKSSRKS